MRADEPLTSGLTALTGRPGPSCSPRWWLSPGIISIVRALLGAGHTVGVTAANNIKLGENVVY